MIKRVVIAITALYALGMGQAFCQSKEVTASAPATEVSPAKDLPQNTNPLFGTWSVNKEPTFIQSTALTLKSKERIFTYQGDVKLLKGDITLSAQTLVGKYDEKNQITDLSALSNILITKGDDIRATGEKVVYDKATETLVLTDNPELTRDGSVLSADLIRIFLKEDRSTAEGNVRVKLLEKEEKKDDKKKAPADGKKKGGGA